MTRQEQRPRGPRGASMARRGLRAGVGAVLCAALLTPAIPGTGISASAAPAPVGQGFTVTPSDLAFILKQIKIAERHAAQPGTSSTSPNCGVMVGSGPNQIPDRLASYGLRSVDGSCNNLFPDRANFGGADQPFPRLTNPNFRPAEGRPADFFGQGDPGSASSSYAQKKGNVYDTQPRIISNLIVDQTSTNPAAVDAALNPVRTQGNPGVHACVSDPSPANPDGDPVGCTPSHQTLFIPNVTTDTGLSPPYNSWFTFFGQFFDHGVDQTVKSGGTVFVPLKSDDPLIAGPDHIFGNADDLPASQRFMVLTRAQNQPGPDGILGDNPNTAVDESADDVQDANNTDSPWVDQSQTYTSHSSHQVFLREYSMDANNHPVSTGKLLGGLVDDDPLPCTKPNGVPCWNDGNATTGSISTWAATKKQAYEKLGLLLQDKDVVNIPLLDADPYGNFNPGPNGLPQYITKGPDGKAFTADDVKVEGNLANPVPVPSDVIYFDTPFLTDIAHNADPTALADTSNPPDGVGDVPVVPDADSTASADFASQPVGTYDDEMLADHFTCGDGRCNENIALTTVHQVFHHEHDRLVGYIDNVLNTDTTASGTAAKTDWHTGGWGYGARLFQAARFVTEMEYQHLVFEEFARKIQPAIRPFHIYSPDSNPAVQAEFAHAVYRFGHSMLDDTVARKRANGTDNSLPLLTAFLNPPEYFNNHNGGAPMTPEAAAGSIVMGSVDQTGNELDEFVTETLRNNLLGLPLDLPVLNMTRARDAGIPPLNDVRRQINADTGDAALAPYTDWSDFGQNMKHPLSLINFVAAYGTHPTILTDAGPDGQLGTGDDGPATLASRRAAARAIVDPSAGDPNANPQVPPDVQPADAADFMFGTGAWANVNGRPTTGLESVDLWVGGLAEATNQNGGLLGSTFNYVFQRQLEQLQDGDRFYYLARTPGMNLRTQLEGNSFSEMIERNTDNTQTLKQDVFGTADCKFQLGNLTWPAVAGSFLTGAGTINDDPTTGCNENRLLLRKPDGTIQYRAVNSVDPSGINGQAVYEGTAGVDRVTGGIDNDTILGNGGNDVIEGNNGDDVGIGGDGNDIITDSNGADVPKGGPGNDALNGGPGDDIPMGGDGQDFIDGGANDNETFAGPGTDFVNAGQGADAVFGDGGDDWIQGGSGQDLLQGDHGAPFFDDPGQAAPGNDVFVGQNGENDYDAEGGDDLMAQNAFVDRNAGAGGFDWAIHQYDTVAANDDMMINNNLGGLPIQVIVLRDRWQETEADSGSSFNDVMLGTDGVLANPRLIAGGGFTGCDAIDQAGLDRIQGLSDVLPPIATWTGTAAEVAALSAAGECPLSGPVWGEGDILLGGPGSDTITGRSGDEVIDGDKEVRVAISVRTNPADPATEIGSTDLMEHKALTGNFGAGTTGMTLQAAVFAGKVNPGNLVITRNVVNLETKPADCGAPSAKNCDTSVYAGPRAQYVISRNADGTVTVLDTTSAPVAPGVAAVGDGSDRLRNIEQLRFTDQTVSLAPPSAPNITSAVSNASAAATVTWTPGPGFASAGVTSWEIVIHSAGQPDQTVTGIPAGSRTRTITPLVNGRTYTFQVRAVNQWGAGALSTVSSPVTPTGPPGTMAAPVATRRDGAIDLTWTAPADNGGSAITSYRIQALSGTTVVATVNTGNAATSGSLTAADGLVKGTAYRFRIAATNAGGTGPNSANSNLQTFATVPDAPVIGTATSGAPGGAVTATATWSLSASTGGSAITGYQVRALRMAADGVTPVGAATTVNVGATITSRVMTLAAGTYRFEIVATNVLGSSAPSARSNLVTAQ